MDFFSKYDQTRSFQWISLHLLKTFLMEDFIFFYSVCSSLSKDKRKIKVLMYGRFHPWKKTKQNKTKQKSNALV